MSEPRYRRMKEERPQQITAAAFEVFAEKGYAAARVQEVAKRAGISKGLMYLYFRTKEDLFKAVIKSVVVRRVDALLKNLETTSSSSEDFLRGPFANFMKRIPGSPISVVIRLLLSEGPRHPDLVDYYWQNVVSKGLQAITRFVERGVQRGEFRASALTELPQLFLAPMIVATLWNMLFARHPIDADRLIDTQINILIAHMRVEAVSDHA